MSTQAAGGVDIILKVDEKPAVMGFTAAGRAAEKMGASAKAAGHTTVTSMQAASASIRLLENPLGNNTRAIERLLSQSKLLSGVMQSAFPIVGAVAMATIIVDLGKKVYDFSQSAKNSLTNVKQGFEALNDSTRKSGIELDVANDKLANTIAKLEHKPENLLALALDEDRKAAFALTEEANRASKTIDELLKRTPSGHSSRSASSYSAPMSRRPLAATASSVPHSQT
ncbi:hypothetical protein [Tunturiibacter gelidiferens]|uniref:hypothetical protein n=1 Tax=Tunturiibacter gelidiferens TaxID=3069689 RepID=UPI003D9ACA93